MKNNDNTAENFINSRPQRLCNMCGKCCRTSTTTKTYEELKKDAENGDYGASEFLRIFQPYSSIEEARKNSKDTVDNIVKMLKADGNYDENKLTFYGCRYIKDDNLCSIYENRPELCGRCPSSPWVVVPPGCGFEGWLFQKREEKKQQIRKIKEDILSLEVMLKEARLPEQIKTINETLKKLQTIINEYAKYGANDW